MFNFSRNIVGCARAAGAMALAAMMGTTASGAVIYVNAGAPSLGNGTSWADATPLLNQALAIAQAGDEIWVATGSYRPDATGANPSGSNDRGVRFVMKTGVGIYGGFVGTETTRDQRNAAVNVTVLTGDIGTQGVRNDNSYGVLAAHAISNATIDGFTIKQGIADGVTTEDTYIGGGIRITGGASIAINNCRFEDNVARGGAHIGCYGATMTLKNSTFLRGWCYVRSGGIDVYSSNAVSIADCVFQENYGPYGGAIYCNEGGNGTIARCRFDRNDSVNGGAISLAGNVVYTVRESVFLKNTCNTNGGFQTSWDGGAVRNWCTNSTFINCVFSGNIADGLGGAFFDGGPSGSNGKLINCTIFGNYSRDGGAVAAAGSHAPSLKNCIVWGNTNGSTQGAGVTVEYSCVEAVSVLAGVGNIALDPLFADADGPDNVVGTIDDDLRLTQASPCIDVGSDAAVPGGTTTDVEGTPRFLNGNVDASIQVDMGAYEFVVPPPAPCYGDANGDRRVSFPDITSILANWGDTGVSGIPGDSDLNGLVSFPDITATLGRWGVICDE